MYCFVFQEDKKGEKQLNGKKRGELTVSFCYDDIFIIFCVKVKVTLEHKYCTGILQYSPVVRYHVLQYAVR